MCKNIELFSLLLLLLRTQIVDLANWTKYVIKLLRIRRAALLTLTCGHVFGASLRVNNFYCIHRVNIDRENLAEIWSENKAAKVIDEWIPWQSCD